MKNLATFVHPITNKKYNNIGKVHGGKCTCTRFVNNDFRSRARMTLWSGTTNIENGILSNEDIFIGTILALGIAFLFSFLQGRSPSSSNIILWKDTPNESDMTNIAIDDPMSLDFEEYDNEISKTKVFDGDMWKEMSRPENYAVYNREVSQLSEDESKPERRNLSTSQLNGQQNPGGKKENKLVLISLLILFVPIFSVEFFFALSRQFICGDYVTNVDDAMWIIDAKKAAAASNGSSPWAVKLCSPATYLEQ